MPKYSTGDAGGGAGGSCELCGDDDADLRTATVAGARLEVCPDCAQHGEGVSTDDDGDRSERDRKQRAARNTARMNNTHTGDSSHWEAEGTDYDDDQLPYLRTDYGKLLTKARQEAGLQLEELAGELDIEESELLAVEQGRAVQAGVGGSVVAKLEDRLGVELADQS